MRSSETASKALSAHRSNSVFVRAPSSNPSFVELASVAPESASKHKRHPVDGAHSNLLAIELMAERFEIAVNPPECLEGAMVYLCLLAYPLAEHDRRRARLFDALWAYIIRSARHSGRLKKGSVPQHAGLLRRFPTQQMWGTLTLANRRIWWRIVAAEQLLFYGTMPATRRKKLRRRDPADVNRDRFWTRNPVLPFPKGFHGGRRYVQGKGYIWQVEEFIYTEIQRKPTITHLVRSISKRLSMPERNVWSQVVKPVRPVLHMADALRSALLERIDPKAPATQTAESPSDGFDCLTLIRQPEWVKRAVSHSCTTAKYWDAYRDWPALSTINPNDFIRIKKRE